MSSVSQKDCIVVLREFEGQDHDWIAVPSYVDESSTERKRKTLFALAADKDFVEIKDARSFINERILPSGEDGRLITSETVYRITALGREQLEPGYLKSWRNIRSNVPTILVSVISTLIALWLASVFGLKK